MASGATYGVSTSIFYVVIFGLWITGCVHSFHKHKDDPAWLQDSPLVLYRGAEFFWHDDFSGINWKQRIKDDVTTAMTLMSASLSTRDVDATKSQIEDFSKKMSAYPDTRKIEVQRGAAMYVQLMGQFADDCLGFADRYEHSAKFELSTKTEDLARRLTSTYGMIGDVVALKRVIDSAITHAIRTPDDISTFRNRITNMRAANQTVFEDVYFRMFKERYIPQN